MIAVGSDTVQPDRIDLHRQYLAYRRRQARALLSLLPRDAVRPLHRKAVEAAPRPHDDPMEILLAYCEALLPLPPFHVWRDDLAAHPDAHLRALDRSADSPTAAAPATLAARRLTRPPEGDWTARLRAFRDEDVWRGFIAFEDAAGRRRCSTSAVFCEADPEDLLDRFVTFEPEALEAFLRSSLP